MPKSASKTYFPCLANTSVSCRARTITVRRCTKLHFCTVDHLLNSLKEAQLAEPAKCRIHKKANFQSPKKEIESKGNITG